MATQSFNNTENKNFISRIWGIKKWRILIIILSVLLIIRILLPYIILHFANKTLAEMEGYYGHIEDIDLSIYRGAYQIDSIYIDKLDSTGSERIPFFSSRRIDLSIHWRALFEGKIVGELAFERPVIKFTKEYTEPSQISGDTSDFRELLDDFMPLRVNRFEINNGTVHYIDPLSSPRLDLQLTEIYILAQNLTSRRDSNLLPSSIQGNAHLYGGSLDLKMKLDPLADHPTFDVNLNMENTDLHRLNDFFKAYGNFDVNKGTMGLYTELAAKEGKFAGYVKPLIVDLDVLGSEDQNDNLFRKLWEGAVGSVAVVFRNQREKQIATKVPIEGTFDDSSTDTWYAVIQVLRNAFIGALQPSLDYEINIDTVDEVHTKEEKKGFLRKVFNGNKDK